MSDIILSNPGVFNESAYHGRQMQAGTVKQRCALQSGFFQKSFNRIFEREALSDPLRRAQQNRIQQAKKNLGKAFLPSNGIKKPWESTHTHTHTHTPHSKHMHKQLILSCDYVLKFWAHSRGHRPCCNYDSFSPLHNLCLPPAVVQVATMGLCQDRLRPWAHSQSPGKPVVHLDATLSPRLPRKAVVTGVWQEISLK